MALPALAVGLCLATTAAAQQPLSAIDWLSDSVATPDVETAPEPPVTANGLPAEVVVTPLDRMVPDAVGLFDATDRGLSAQVWAASSAQTVARQIAGMRAPRLPAAQRLLHDILIARAVPPRGSTGGQSFFLTRVDALLALGAFGSAKEMMGRAGHETPEIFRRWFDLTLLTGDENRACARMRALPEITPTYPARIFCLARSGDWHAAALTLETAQALGVVTAAEMERLARFLDDFPTGGSLSPPPLPTPLDYMLYEAMGEPLATSALPLPFAHGDLRRNTGWKMRIEAAERLVRFGAIPPERLWEIYAERAPAASGAFWDRVAAAKALERTITEAEADPKDADAISALGAALIEAWRTTESSGLRSALARRYGARLAALPLEGDAEATARGAALLAGAWEEIGALPQGPVAEIVAGRTPTPDSPTTQAIAAGLDGAEPPSGARALFDEGRTGEALIYAAGLLDDARAGNLDALTDALAILVAADQPDRARHAAVEILVLGIEG